MGDVVGRRRRKSKYFLSRQTMATGFEEAGVVRQRRERASFVLNQYRVCRFHGLFTE